MRVKRYVVDSMPDALQRIRSDLGKDAVILNTKEVRSGGFLGLFGKKKIEVIAAIDTTPSGTMEKPALNVNVKSGTPAPSASSAPIDHAAAKSQTSVGVLEEKLPPLMEAPHFKLNTKDDLLLEEMKQMKEMVQRLTSINKDRRGIPPAFHKVELRLLDQEIDPIIVESVLSDAIEEAGDAAEQLTEQQVRLLVRKSLLDLLKFEGRKSVLPQTRIAHFVGPTGVGKTTTIAKMAAEQVLKHNRKVGFITSDTYRIAAVEQLKTYATILNVPLEVVFSPQELTKAFHQLQDRDIIFMDTAGRNYRNEMYVSELNSLLQTKEQSETFLVLSLTTKYKDMRIIAENFSKFKLDKVLYTKLDETLTYGAVINLAKEFRLRHSYVTNGQNVPDDIVELDEEHLVDLVLEEDIT